MKLRAITTVLALVMILTVVGGCSKTQEGLDVAGLKLGKDLTGLLGDATKLLGGITDLDGAKAALPKLQGMESDLGGIISKVASLSPESKESMAGMVKGALPALEGAISKVSENPEIGATLKPVLTSFLGKIKGLI